jgi:pyrimidine deaminase RibD-like protein
MTDATYMQRALDLAVAMCGRTGENPSVGCVIVRDGAIMAEAATGEGGRPHAEEAALAQAGDAAWGGVAYVTLEPCARRSTDTLSCTDRLIAAKISRVVIATRDPHPMAAGAGIARLGEAGIIVELGLLETSAQSLNADFLARWAPPRG